ncbi:MAG: class I SAM-dependent methyltransferase [Rhodospirillaceae bacterium]|jgi:ubiquinone/menaquinone biosynthesis C-methylase UbiE|nr:class I SAM-dependent methyltransferase [Rhodospirillaceae bacterium]MBT6509370.1 class I SAM-dependent methyltransferase [Rhodospirillaceae bacterium]MBT7615281.1 class I SAM-dependent methyltransferase [Rhodospirillaceae bacterium]MBT7646842.1 class I SAM-dependent methyltransferase [Rhodospirillaceae bacterium]
MKFIDVLEAKAIYQKGENVTNFLRKKFGSEDNTSEIIEIAYDLQAGSYVENVKSNVDKADSYASELSKILNDNLERGDSMLDVGTGEITTLTLVLNKLKTELSDILALDISWSRLSIGMKFHREYREKKFPLKVFVADIKAIPLHGKCVDVVTSSHALEPNGKNLETLLLELFRVTKKKLVLFEPSYELNSEEGKVRMDKLGYIKNIEVTVSKLGGKVIDVVPIRYSYNPLNPTACYIIEPPTHIEKYLEVVTLCVPSTNFELKYDGQYFFSKDTGLVFPVLDDIAVLKTSSAILATSKC